MRIFGANVRGHFLQCVAANLELAQLVLWRQAILCFSGDVDLIEVRPFGVGR